MDHEHRAAVVCALTAMCVARQQYVAVGDSRNGYIILPPQSEPSVAGMQPWAMTMILANAREATDWEVGGLKQKPPGPHIVVADGQEVSLMDAAVE
jgi:hypothetical protein